MTDSQFRTDKARLLVSIALTLAIAVVLAVLFSSCQMPLR
jgi:hypothetical protein